MCQSWCACCFFIVVKIKTSIQPAYKEGSTMSRLKFALFPHRIGDKLVWMERYEVLFVRVVDKVNAEIDGNPVEFSVGYWKQVSEAII